MAASADLTAGLSASADLTTGLSASATLGEQETTDQAAVMQPEADEPETDLPQPTDTAVSAEVSPPSLAVCKKITGKDACLQR